jgi:hypothetical protein
VHFHGYTEYSLKGLFHILLLLGLFSPLFAEAGKEDGVLCDFKTLRTTRPVTKQSNFKPVGDLAPKYQPTIQKAYVEYQQKLAGDAGIKALHAKLAEEKDPATIESLRTIIEKAEQTLFKNALTKYLKEDELEPLLIVDAPIMWKVAGHDGKAVDLPVHLAQAFTFDHHGPFLRADKKDSNIRRNSSKQVLEHIKRLNKDPLGAQKLAELEATAASTDNLADGVLAIWILRHASRVANDPELQRDLAAATFYEDFGLFGTKYDALADPNIPSREQLVRGKEIAEAILQDYDLILQESRERNPNPQYGVNFSDRFGQLPESEQKIIVDKALSVLDRHLSTKPEDLAARKAKSQDFRHAVELAKQSAEVNHEKSKQHLMKHLEMQGFDTEHATALVNEFSSQIYIIQTLNPNSPGVGRFSTWAAIPRAHTQNTQVEIIPMGFKTGFVQAHPHGRAANFVMSDVAVKLRELNQQRAVIDAENAAKSAMARAESLGLPPEVVRQNGKDAYDEMYKAASMAVGSRPGNSDFNFSFTGVRASPEEILNLYLDSWLIQRQEQMRAKQATP